MKPSSGSAKTSWGGATSLRNRRSTLSENSTRLRNAPMAVTEKVLLQNQVTESVGRTIQKLRDYLKNLEDKMEELL